LAKIAGLKMCAAYNKQYGTNFISAMPTNLYGPGDSFDVNNSHVIPALIKKFHDAKIKNLESVVVWGSGKALREFLFVDDLAQALLALMQSYNESLWINVGTGVDISIAQLSRLIQKVVGFKGTIEFDMSKPDGTQRKLLDVTRIHNFGWKHTTGLEEGLVKTYDWFLSDFAYPRLPAWQATTDRQANGSTINK
jgi:GDP-L-fucose synthase